MRKAAWGKRLEQLAALKQRTGAASVDAHSHSESLHDWLEHQKALLAIGAPQLTFQSDIQKNPCLAADGLCKDARFDASTVFSPCSFAHIATADHFTSLIFNHQLN